jgi:hypothetical protein
MHLREIQQNLLQYILPALAVMLVFVFSNHLHSYQTAVQFGFSDVLDYVRIANSFGSDEFYKLSSVIPAHRLERWPLHYLLGGLAGRLHIDIWVIYFWAVIGCIFITFYLTSILKTAPLKKLAFFSLVLLSPYAFRQYLAVPGMLSDAIFFTAVIGMSVGFFNRQMGMIVFWLVISCIVRQTGIILIFVYLIYCLVERVRSTWLLGGVGLALMGFLLVKYLTSSLFSVSSSNYLAMHTLGIFSWFSEGPEWSVGIDFIGRYGLMILSLSPILLLVNRISPRKEWMYVIFFFMLHSQPLLAGPEVSGSNVDRLAIYGLPFLGILLLNSSWRIYSLFLFVTLLFLESLLPQFSILRGIPGGSYLYLSVVLAVSMLTIWLALSSKNP